MSTVIFFFNLSVIQNPKSSPRRSIL